MVKKLLYTVLVVLWCAVAAYADGPVWTPSTEVRQIAWDANTEPDMKEYRVYRRLEGSDYDMSAPWMVVPHPQTSPTVGVMDMDDEGQNWIIVTAVDQSDSESEPSNEVGFVWDMPPSAPTGIRVFICTQDEVDTNMCHGEP